MTPKEKANELYSLYYNRIEHTLSEEYSPHEKDIVKECALVAVNEIVIIQQGYAGYRDELKTYLDYWMQVKQEIEKL